MNIHRITSYTCNKFQNKAHSFKTLAFLRGERSKIGQICWRIVVKNCRQRGVKVKNRHKFTNVLNGHNKLLEYSGAWKKHEMLLNTSYLTDSYISFTLKMESVSKSTIFGLKMMVKSGLEKIILKSLHVER